LQYDNFIPVQEAMKGGFRSSRIGKLAVGLRVKRKGGFTIVELVVALAIMGIAVSVAIPGFSRWLPDYRLKAAATDLYANLQLAKMSAVRDNAEWAIAFNKDFDAYQIRFGTGVNGGYADPGAFGVDKTVILKNYGGGVCFGHGSATAALGGGWDDEITFANNTVVFKPRGMAEPEGYVYVQNQKNATYAVGSLTTGLILMRKWTGTAWE
jgi:prepilin-type N-terminal cleavage/methylation domain-containing protein